MKDTNLFRISGVVTAAPETKLLKNGSVMAKLVVVVADEQQNQRPRFHRIGMVCFDKAASDVAELRAGDRIAVEGCFDTFAGMSASGKPFARTIFKALAVAKIQPPPPPPVVEGASFVPAMWQELLRAEQRLLGDLSPREQAVLSKATERITRQQAPAAAVVQS